MKKYAKIINEVTKECEVGIGTDEKFYKNLGMTLQDVEKSYTGGWYLTGYAPQKPEPTYQEQRVAAYPSIPEQLDMIYWDRVNGTNLWQEKISEIKKTYPKC